VGDLISRHSSAQLAKEEADTEQEEAITKSLTCYISRCLPVSCDRQEASTTGSPLTNSRSYALVELLADPKLFLLDEPTSGLDPGLDRAMMELLLNVAHKDKRTVAVVTHATDNISICDRVLFLGRGGKLCFYGTPKETLLFFGCSSFTEIYLKLQTDEKIEFYQTIYRSSPYYRAYITACLQPPSNSILSFTTPQSSLARQWRICCHRQLKLTRRDRVNLLLSILVAPSGIGLLKVAISDVKPFTATVGAQPNSAIQVLLVFVCACLWVGLKIYNST
jgi:ABC transport system ATP-binding/permease protein